MSCQPRLGNRFCMYMGRKDAEGSLGRSLPSASPNFEARLDMRLTEEQRPHFRSIWELHFVCGEKTPSVESMADGRRPHEALRSWRTSGLIRRRRAQDGDAAVRVCGSRIQKLRGRRWSPSVPVVVARFDATSSV